MKTVIKCDYCTHTESIESAADMLKHERECCLNPSAKDCGTCKNHEQFPYSSDFVCKYGWAFEDEKTLPCEKWEPINNQQGEY